MRPCSWPWRSPYGWSFTLVWYLGGRVARATHADAKVEQFLDTDGAELPDEERIKDDGGFREGIGGL